MRGAVGVDASTITHRLDCAKGLKITTASAVTSHKIADNAHPARSAASLKKTKTKFNEL